MSQPSKTASDQDLSTWAWVDKNADDLRGDIVTHLKVYGLGPQEVEDCLRVVFISIRQWATARAEEVKRLELSGAGMKVRAAELAKRDAEIKRLREALDLELKLSGERLREIKALRLYGNKDCTAMADEALKAKGVE